MNSIDPSLASRNWTLTRLEVLSNSGTSHQVMTSASPSVRRNTPAPFDGSRSAKIGATRGGPVRNRATFRSVLAWSSETKLTLPSELRKASVYLPEQYGKVNGNAIRP